VAGESDGVILVGGEALIDLVAKGDDTLSAHPGGGPFNAARTIGRLEQPVSYLGRLSTDRFGNEMATILADDDVRLDAVVRTDDPTTLALAELDEQGSAKYRFYTEGTAAAGLTAEDALAALPARVDTILVGTLGLVLEPMAGALEAVVERLAGDALVAVDPNCRPWVISDPEGYRRRLTRVLRRSDLLKLSEEDADWLQPGAPPVDATRALIQGGPAVAVLTRGGEGAVVVTADADVTVKAPEIEVVDTIGAGDAFGGGFVAWWHARGLGHDDLADIDTVAAAAEFACLIAARTCERPGASPPHLSELEAGVLG
jgi:fructokinase